MLLSRRTSVHPLGGVICALEEIRAVTPASIASPGTTAAGRAILSEEDLPEELEEETLVSDEEMVMPPVSSARTPEACGANTAAKAPKRKRVSMAAASRGRLPNTSPESAD
jgi:hypothetical protein